MKCTSLIRARRTAGSLVNMRRTTLAIALATGALAVPAVALAAGGDDATTPPTTPTQSTAPVQQEQPRQAPDGHPCPEGQQGEGSGGSGSSGGGSGATAL
jgi:hypothetical protein